MKKISIIVALFFTSLMFGQMNRGVGVNQYRSEPPKTEKKDPIEQSLIALDKQLKLDDFQKAAVKVLLEEHQKESMKIVASNSSDAQKGNLLQKEKEKLDEQIGKILNPNQIEAFEKFKAKMSPDKSNKKSKKKRKDTEIIDSNEITE
jgi:hypothetical protein